MKTSIQNSKPNSLPQRSGAAVRPRFGASLAAFFLTLVFLLFGATQTRAQGVPPGCTGSAIGISLFTSAPDVHIGDTLFYSVSVFNGLAGNPTSCDASNVVASITTPDGIIHPIVLRRTYLTHTQSDFYTNIVSYVVRAQDIRPDGTVRATAEVTAVIRQNDTPSQGGANQGVNTEVSLPCIQVSALCVGGVGENGLITFTGSVTNCGNNTLVGVTVTNYITGGGAFQVTFITNLLRGQSATFTGSFIPANPCGQNTATLVAHGVDQFTTFPRSVNSTSSITCGNTTTPGIRVTKECPTQPVAPGQFLVFSGTVSNTGNVTLTNVIVVNSQPVSNTVVFTRASLAPGEVASFTGSYKAPTNCAVTDELFATATSVCGAPVGHKAQATCPVLTTPQLLVTALCAPGAIVPGGLVTYGGNVRNTGDITLTNVVVVSDRPSPNTVVFSGTLAPGASGGFNGTYAVPLGVCSITTTFRGTGVSICTGASTTNTTSATCPITTAPAIAVTLVCPTTPVAAGALITYTGTVRNSGNVTLNNIVVANNQPAPNTVVLNVTSLAPGATANFTASFITPSNVCSVSSTVTASGSDNCTAVVVSNNASTTCPLLTTPRLVVIQNCPPTPATVGGLLTYTGSVSNSGNITLTNVVVTNDRSGATPVFTAPTLAPGAAANFTGSYTVPANSGCSVNSTTTASAHNQCTGSNIIATTTVNCPVLGNSRIAVTLVCPPTPTPLGGTLTFSGTVSNIGNTTLTNVTVTRDTPGPNTVVFTQATLAPGASAAFTGSYTVSANNACSSVTAVTARAGDQCGASNVLAIASVSCPLATTPQVRITQVCPITPGVPGGFLLYVGTVSNSGNVNLTNIIVTSHVPVSNTVVFTAAFLAPGASTNFTTSVKAAADACSLTSTLFVLAYDQCSGTIANHKADTTCPLITSPQIAVTKTCPTQPVVGGGLLVFTGTVTNTGNITLTNVFVVNNQPSANTGVIGPITLAPGAGTNFTGSYAAPLNACSVTDTLTATGRDKCTGVTVTNARTATCAIATAPGIAVTLTCPTAPTVPGGLITYTGTVRNSGNVTLNNVRVVNNQPAPNTQVFTVASLAPGASANFTASFTTPLDACSVSSTVVGSGADACSQLVVSNTASATCTLITAPRITVTQNCPAVPTSGGGLLTYSGTVSNAGNITLTNVVVTNDRTGATPVFTAATLAPGASANFTGSYTVPTSAGCSITSTVTARGGDKCTGSNVTASATATCQVATAPAIRVTLTCPLVAPPLGGTLTYSGTVSNSGNVTLSNVVVLNNRSGATPIFTAVSLAPGQTTNFTGSYQVPPNCCTVSSTVTASGRDCNGIVATDTASSTCPVLTSPRLVVTKVCPTTAVGVGEVLRYSGTVSNAGNITLVNVTVVNNQPTNGAPVIGPLTLAPGESASYIASYIVPADFCGTDTLTARGTSICDVTIVTNLTTTCPVITTPDITVTKICPAQPARRGTVFVFTGSVSNSGNVTLTNVFVVNNQPAANTPVLGPITLAPRASSNFTGSYIAPVDCCETVDTLTARGQDRCSGSTVTDTASEVCPLLTTPAIAVAQTCPPASQPIGTVWQFTGSVTNTGDINLTNVFVVSSQPNNTRLLGPIELAPGESEGFSGSYIITGGTNTIIVTNRNSTIMTNTTTVIVTNSAGTITTNMAGTVTTNNTSTVTTNAAGPTTFVTINTINQSVVDRFGIGTNFNSLTYAPEDHGYAATQFYAIRRDPSAVSFFDTITASTGTTADRFNATSRNFDALAYAAPDVGYGPVIFYYLSHDNGGVSTFGTIAPGGVVGVVTDRFVVGSGFDALTFSATDLGYGANLFYYVRHDATGLSTFGTINPALPGTVTDRFPIGTNVEALVFTDLVAPGYGPNNFYYLRRGANGVSTLGTIFITSPTTAAVTDRFTVGTNASELTFTATDVGYGANLFYALRGRTAGLVTNTTTTFTTNTTTTFTTNTTTTFTTNTATTFTTNTTTTFTTNSVVFTVPNIVTASGIDICQARTVTAQASCSGSSSQPGPRIGGPGNPPTTFSNGTFRGSFATQNGVSYTVQYKNSLNDAAWTNLYTVTGTGGTETITDVTGTRPMRFYRVITP